MKKTISSRGKAILSIAIFLFSSTAEAQVDKHLGEPIPTDPVFASRNDATVDYLSARRNTRNETSNMKGTPYFIAEWVSGVVVFKGNKLLNSNDLQFNWVKNELHTRYNGQVYKFDDSVIEFVLLDTTVQGKSTEILFRNGYPATGTHSRISFYQVIIGGANFELLKYWARHDHDSFEGVGTYVKEFYRVADLYLYDMKSNTIQYINLKPSSIERAIPASYAKTVKQASSTIQGKKFSEAELISLVQSLNNL